MNSPEYRPSPEELRRQLPDIGEGIQAALQTLHAAPNPAACELAAIRLDGIKRHVLSLGEALRREVPNA